MICQTGNQDRGLAPYRMRLWRLSMVFRHSITPDTQRVSPGRQGDTGTASKAVLSIVLSSSKVRGRSNSCVFGRSHERQTTLRAGL